MTSLFSWNNKARSWSETVELTSGQGICVEAQRNSDRASPGLLRGSHTLWQPAFLMSQCKTPSFFRHRWSGSPPQPSIPSQWCACPLHNAPTTGQETRVTNLEKGRWRLCSSKAEKMGASETRKESTHPKDGLWWLSSCGMAVWPRWCFISLGHCSSLILASPSSPGCPQNIHLICKRWGFKTTAVRLSFTSFLEPDLQDLVFKLSSPISRRERRSWDKKLQCC